MERNIMRKRKLVVLGMALALSTASLTACEFSFGVEKPITSEKSDKDDAKASKKDKKADKEDEDDIEEEETKASKKKSSKKETEEEPEEGEVATEEEETEEETKASKKDTKKSSESYFGYKLADKDYKFLGGAKAEVSQGTEAFECFTAGKKDDLDVVVVALDMKTETLTTAWNEDSEVGEQFREQMRESMVSQINGDVSDMTLKYHRYVVIDNIGDINGGCMYMTMDGTCLYVMMAKDRDVLQGFADDVEFTGNTDVDYDDDLDSLLENVSGDSWANSSGLFGDSSLDKDLDDNNDTRSETKSSKKNSKNSNVEFNKFNPLDTSIDGVSIKVGKSKLSTVEDGLEDAGFKKGNSYPGSLSSTQYYEKETEDGKVEASLLYVDDTVWGYSIDVADGYVDIPGISENIMPEDIIAAYGEPDNDSEGIYTYYLDDDELVDLTFFCEDGSGIMDAGLWQIDVDDRSYIK